MTFRDDLLAALDGMELPPGSTLHVVYADAQEASMFRGRVEASEGVPVTNGKLMAEHAVAGTVEAPSKPVTIRVPRPKRGAAAVVAVPIEEGPIPVIDVSETAVIMRETRSNHSCFAVIQRLSPTQARWLYLSGGLDDKGTLLCGGEMMAFNGEKRGLIRNLLFRAGITEIVMTCDPDNPVVRGATEAGYVLTPQPDGTVVGVRTLTEEEPYT